MSTGVPGARGAPGARKAATAVTVCAVAFGATKCTPEPGIPAGPAPGVTVATFPVVPMPARLQADAGSFVPVRGTAITVPVGVDPRVRRAAERLARRLRSVWSLPIPVVEAGAEPTTAGSPVAGAATATQAGIRIVEDRQVPGGDEAYRLAVGSDGIVLTAAGPAGFFYGLQTLDQLVPELAPAGAPGIPAVTIEDAPRFPYRGMHLDVGRHFFGVEFVKRYLDAMAAYKLNRFHWHLTEDQGWRLEIRSHPRLTEVGACRDETMVGRNSDPYVGDGRRYCGHYTQAEAREIVAYARDRFITVIPEIEMPGHSLAALAAYPELACTPGPFAVGTRWGIYEDIYCPGEATFDFLEDVLTEVMEIFPGPYIHIGGDEAPKTRWEESSLAQGVIEREELADESALQSWFLSRIERFVTDRGRRIIGWDEILEGGLPPRATVMSWRGVDGGIEAARQGHDVIMTPTSHLYFDYYQGDPAYEPLAIGGFTPLEHVYAFEPVPAELGPAEAQHILGAQGNVWTEYLSTGSRVEYMVFPRMLALAEVTWSPMSARDWDHFISRLPAQFQRLARLGMNYRLPDVQGIGSDRLTLEDAVTVGLQAPVPGGVIRYTLDGSEPTSRAPEYRRPLTLRVDSGPVTVAARVFSQGRAGPVRRSTFSLTTLEPAMAVEAGAMRPGLLRTGIAGEFDAVAQVERGTRSWTDVARRIALPGSVAGGERGAGLDPAGGGTPGEGQPYGLIFTGYVQVPTDAVYTFRLTSDDGSALSIDGRGVVANDGPHGTAARDGQVALAAGFHRLELRYFQAGGGQELELLVGVGEAEPGEIPEGWLLHSTGG